MEIKLCNTLLSWKLNSALLEIRLSSLFHFRSALGPELANNPRACCLSSFARIGLPKRSRCTIVHPTIQHNFLCRSLLQAHIGTSHSVCLNSFALLHKNCVVYRPTCQYVKLDSPASKCFPLNRRSLQCFPTQKPEIVPDLREASYCTETCMLACISARSIWCRP